MPWNPRTDLPNLTGYLSTYDGSGQWTGTIDASTHPQEFQDYTRVEGVGGLNWTATLSASPWIRFSGNKAAMHFSSLGSGQRRIILTSSTSQFNHFHVSGTGYCCVRVKFDSPTTASLQRICDSRNGVSTSKGWGMARTPTGAIICNISGTASILSLTSADLIGDTNWHYVEFAVAAGANGCWVRIDGGTKTFGTLGTLTTGDAVNSLCVGSVANSVGNPANAMMKEWIVCSAIPSDPDLALLAAWDPDFVSGYDTSIATALGVKRVSATGTVTDYPGATTSATDLGTALQTANAAASAGDALILGAATYDLGTTALEQITNTAIVGLGKTQTTILSGANSSQTSGKCCVQMGGASGGSGDVIKDLWIRNEPPSLTNYGFPVGRSASSSGVVTNACLSGCKVTGYSDAVFIANDTTGNTFVFANCEMQSAYDVIALTRSSGGDIVRGHFSTFTVAGPFQGLDATGGGPPSPLANNILTSGGRIDLFDCTIRTVMPSFSTTATCLRTSTGGGAINATRCAMSSTGGPTGTADVDNDGVGSTITVTGGYGSGAGGVPTTTGDGAAGVTLTGPWTPPSKGRSGLGCGRLGLGM